MLFWGDRPAQDSGLGSRGSCHSPHAPRSPFTRALHRSSCTAFRASSSTYALPSCVVFCSRARGHASTGRGRCALAAAVCVSCAARARAAANRVARGVAAGGLERCGGQRGGAAPGRVGAAQSAGRRGLREHGQDRARARVSLYRRGGRGCRGPAVPSPGSATLFGRERELERWSLRSTARCALRDAPACYSGPRASARAASRASCSTAPAPAA